MATQEVTSRRCDLKSQTWIAQCLWPDWVPWPEVWSRMLPRCQRGRRRAQARRQKTCSQARLLGLWLETPVPSVWALHGATHHEAAPCRACKWVTGSPPPILLSKGTSHQRAVFCSLQLSPCVQPCTDQAVTQHPAVTGLGVRGSHVTGHIRTARSHGGGTSVLSGLQSPQFKRSSVEMAKVCLPGATKLV